MDPSPKWKPVLSKLIEHGHGSAGWEKIVDIVNLVGTKDMDALNSLRILVTVRPDLLSDVASGDDLYIGLGQTSTKLQGIFTTGSINMGSLIDRELFQPYLQNQGNLDEVSLYGKTANWGATETHIIHYLLEIFQDPVSTRPVVVV